MLKAVTEIGSSFLSILEHLKVVLQPNLAPICYTYICLLKSCLILKNFLQSMDDRFRPSTPNTVMYNEDIKPKMSQGFRPPSGNSLAPPAPTYKSPCPGT